MLRLLRGFIWKDARVFAADRQAVVMAFIIPVLIASILGWLDTNASTPDSNQKTSFYLVDEDRSDISRAISEKLAKNKHVSPLLAARDQAEAEVKTGSVAVAAIIPKGFGEQAGKALVGEPKPTVLFLTDPSKPADVQMVEAQFMTDAPGVVANQVFGSMAGDASSPLTTKEQSVAAEQAKWAHAAHDYSGFGLQGLLFFAIEAAISLGRERRLGIWRRLRAAPVPPYMFVLSKGISSTLLAFGIILGIFAVGALLFGIRILGSFTAFFGIALSGALMAATFGLLFATFGKSESQARGVSILVILIMLATGGAWFPMSQMPNWVQKGAEFLPVRWAVEGFDAVTWRGLGLAESAHYAGILLVFALVFGLGAVWRFRALR